MASIEDHNQIITKGGYLVTTDSRIRQYVEFGDYLIIRTCPKREDFDALTQKNKVTCYNDLGEIKWIFGDENINDLCIRNNKLFLHDSSSLGYEYEIDIKTGDKLKVNIVK